MIARELNKINITYNGRTISINFASFSFEVVNERLLIYDNSELVLVLPNEKELVNQAYAAINIKGKQGERGIKGDEGKQGIQGEKGDKGEDGKDGQDGKDGLDGKAGKDGKNGIDGKAGKDGIDRRH